ncbi:MAG: (p)ppGpp synthase/HD superfamily hydrolase [Myxococcota bacterium]|jgi:(p)ppGpp synthase/HD superfamily hydrolase
MEDKISRARALAAAVHAGQRYGTSPYTVHLAAAVAVLERFGFTDPELLAAAWLHDALEDTALSRETLAAQLGDRVASLVDAVTDGPGTSRAERKARPYSLIPLTPDAILIKLADRIANVESAQTSKPRLLAMYRLEQLTFRSKLSQPGVALPMWTHLESLFVDAVGEDSESSG